MKIPVLVCSILFFYLTCQSKTIKGKILDQKTNEFLAFVNIGIPNKNIGTVSDLNGRFTFDIPANLLQDTLKFSMIGFKNTFLPITSISDDSIIVGLQTEALVLKEINVKPRNLKFKKLGNNTDIKKNFVSFDNYKLPKSGLGAEIAIPIKIKKSPTYINKISVSFTNIKYDSITLRLNIYKNEMGMPGENILKEPIYITIKNKKNVKSIESFDLEKYDLVINNDVIISLECLDNISRFGLSISSTFFTGTTYMKSTSQEKWRKYPFRTGIQLLVAQ